MRYGIFHDILSVICAPSLAFLLSTSVAAAPGTEPSTNHPAVLQFAATEVSQPLWRDDFSGNWQDRWPLKWVGAGEERTFSLERGGETWLRVTYPKGEVGKGFKFRVQQEPRDRMFLEYKLRFSEDFDWIKGGKLPGLSGGRTNVGGNPPNGKDGWSVRFMWRTDGIGSAYVYHPDQPRKWGEHFRLDNFWFEKGLVHTIGLEVIMNTPGKHDGIIRAWLDGVLVVEETAIRFRDIADLKIDTLHFGTIFGGHTANWAPGKDEHIDFGSFQIFSHHRDLQEGLAPPKN